MTDATEPTPQPTMLYRAGETVNPEAWNLKLETLVVDALEVAAHKAEGWLSAAEVHDKLIEPKAKAGSAKAGSAKAGA